MVRLKRQDEELPFFVKVISTLYYIGAVLSFFYAVMALIAGAFISAFGTVITIIAAVALTGLGILNIFIGRGLRARKNWARITAIVLAVISVLSGFVNVFKGQWIAIVTIMIGGIIAGYLLFSTEAKKTFTS